MSTVEKKRSVFGDQLRPILTEKNVSLRKLGRMIDPEHPEHGRRGLARWVGGHHKPTRENRNRVADALGVDRSVFDDEDDEEDHALAIELMTLLRRVLKQETAEALV